MMNDSDKSRMQWILFFVFVGSFLVLVAATSATVFLGFGSPTPEERSLLTKVFIGEVGAAVIALFYSVFSLRQGTKIPGDGLAEESNEARAASISDLSRKAGGSISSSGFLTSEMLSRILAEARDRFWIVGLKNSRLANLQAEILHELNARPSLEIRVLFLDWRSPYIVLEFYKHCVQTPGQRFAETIKSNHALFSGNRGNYQQLWGKRLALRAYSEFPVYPMIITDDRVYLGMYVRNVPDKEISTYNSPYVAVPQTVSLGRVAVAQFDATWSRARCLSRADDTRWVLFDLDNTLYDSPEMRAAYEEHAMRLFAAETKLSLAQAASKWEERKQALATENAYLPPPRELLRSFGIPLGHWAQVTQEIIPQTYLHVDSELQELLASVSSVRRIGLLTNNNRFQAEATLEALGVKAFFDEIICADELGGLKPDNLVLTNAIKKMGAKAENVIVIGDNAPVDLLPAKSLGLTALQLNRTNLSKILHEL
jgi:FMN phosphatase YigB (HAD superfamily)